jgi:hypothetical protein
MSEGRVYIPCSCDSGSEGAEEENEYILDVYDNHLKCRFNLRASYLWSIHDYLAYDKFVN